MNGEEEGKKEDEEEGRDPSGEGRQGEPEATVDQFMRESGLVEQEVIEIAARDIERSSDLEARLALEKAAKKESFYSDLIYTLTHLRHDEREARVLWVNLLAHKMDMSYRLERNVGIRVAALDYFKNILGLLEDVKIIGHSAFIETAHLAVTDGLTGVFNHRYFQDRLERDILRAQEEKTALSLLMIDIDHFKQYNDLNGHIAGDVALKEVAGVLRRNLKRADLVARYGGEEFAVILAGLPRQQALPVAERIRRKIEEKDIPNEIVLPNGKLTISIGLAEFPSDASGRSSLISRADRALYLAKAAGRNRVSLAPLDQRRNPRFPSLRPVRFRLMETPDSPEKMGRMENLSSGGICLVHAGPMASGQVLSLTIEGLPEGLLIQGRVVWRLPRSEGSWRYGVQFLNLDPVTAGHLSKIMA